MPTRSFRTARWVFSTRSTTSKPASSERLPEAVSVLLAENFDGFVVEGEAAIALEQATNARQHFPSLNIFAWPRNRMTRSSSAWPQQQKIMRVATNGSERSLRRHLHDFVRSLAQGGIPAEGIDPCHSLIGNLNQFSAAEILQMSCLGQRSGRFTFKSGRGNSEIYLAHGSVRHAVFGSLGRRIGRRGNFPVAAGPVLF